MKKMRKSKKDTLLEALGIAFLVFVLGMVIMNAMFQTKFQNAYNRGYEQGKKECSVVGFNISDMPDSVNYGDELPINFSLNFSS